MARPRLNPAERRTRQINVRVTEAEAAALAEQAGRARLTVAAYLRRRGLGRRVRAAAERRLAAEDRRELNRIGVNLNQMVRLMHSGRAVHPGLRAAAKRAAVVVETILDESHFSTVNPEQFNDFETPKRSG